MEFAKSIVRLCWVDYDKLFMLLDPNETRPEWYSLLSRCANQNTPESWVTFAVSARQPIWDLPQRLPPVITLEMTLSKSGDVVFQEVQGGQYHRLLSSVHEVVACLQDMQSIFTLLNNLGTMLKNVDYFLAGGTIENAIGKVVGIEDAEEVYHKLASKYGFPTNDDASH